MSHCHRLMRIPTREEHGSMNLGQAVAVCLYELVRDPKPGGPGQKQALATAGQLERLTLMLLEALQASGYTQPDATASAEEKIRRLVRRLNLEARDAEVWLGMLRQIAWRLRVDKKAKG